MNILTLLRESKQILFICPCCNEVFRLSDATLFTKEHPVPSEFDRLEEAERRLARAAERFSEQEEALRQKAVARGQQAAKRKLRSIARPFAERKIDPQDVKVLFHPVEFLVFRGMTEGEVSRIAFIDRPADSRERDKVQESMARTVKAGNYEWRLLRITAEGMVTAAEK